MTFYRPYTLTGHICLLSPSQQMVAFVYLFAHDNFLHASKQCNKSQVLETCVF